jgi:hypothetical protein
MAAESSKPVSVKYSEVLDAFEFVSAGMQYEHQAYIGTNTGTVYFVSDMIDLEEELPEDLETADHYINVPHKNALNLGRNLVFAFVDEHLPNQSNAVRDIFRSKGAYRRFRGMLESRGILDKWYAFEANATEEALRAWCEEANIQLDDPPASTATG